MFGIGMWELIVIALVLLVAVGPQRMPKLLKAVGKAYREFRRATRDLRSTTGIDDLLQDEDIQSLANPLAGGALAGAAAAKKKQAAVATMPQIRDLHGGQAARELPAQGVDVAEARYRAKIGRAKTVAAAAAPEEPVSAEAEAS